MKKNIGYNLSDCGTNNANSKLTEEQVIEIRKKLIPYAAMARKYKVNICTIKDVIRNRSWKHLL